MWLFLISRERDSRDSGDPQTSGRLLIAVEDSAIPNIEKIFKAHGLNAVSFGELFPKKDLLIEVV